MQSDVMKTRPSKDHDRRGVRHLVPCFLDNFVPKATEVALQLGESISYVKVGKCFQGVPIIETGANGLANEVDRDGKRQAIIAMGDIVTKFLLRQAKCISSKPNPTAIAFRHACKDLSDYALCIVRSVFVIAGAMRQDLKLARPHLGDLRHLIPAADDNVARK